METDQVLLSDNRAVMDALLRAISDPGSITPRAPLEPVTSWQRRAVVEGAGPLIQAAERERCAKIAEDKAVALDAAGDEAGTECATLHAFAASLREAVR